MHPADTQPFGFITPALGLGERYMDYANRFAVTTVSARPSALQLRILVAPADSPTLLFASPSDNAVLKSTVQVNIDALDRGGISKVELYRDSILLDTQTTAPYLFLWDTTKETVGAHALTAKAYNAAGQTFSQDLHVTVNQTSSGPLPPAISIVQPVNNPAVVTLPFTLSARATARSGSVTRVEFFSDGLSLGVAKSSGADLFTLTWDLVSAGVHTVVATVTDSNSSTWISNPIQIQPIPQITGGPVVISGLGAAPGALVTIYGTGFAPTPSASNGATLPASLGNVSVTFNGIPAPLSYVSDTQINAQVPWNVLPPGATSATATVLVNSLGANGIPKSVDIAPVAPSIFALGYSAGQAVAINADGTLAAAAGSVAGLTTHPAAGGDTIVILATGLGAVTPPIENGRSASDALRTTIATPVVLIGGAPAAISFSGLSPQFPGVNQLNVVVPPGSATGDAVPLQIRIGGVTTSDKVTLAVR